MTTYTPGTFLARLVDLLQGAVTAELAYRITGWADATGDHLLDVINEARRLVAHAQRIEADITTLQQRGYTTATVDLRQPPKEAVVVGQDTIGDTGYDIHPVGNVWIDFYQLRTVTLHGDAIVKTTTGWIYIDNQRVEGADRYGPPIPNLIAPNPAPDLQTDIALRHGDRDRIEILARLGRDYTVAYQGKATVCPDNTWTEL